MRKSQRAFLLFHCIAIGCVALFPLYRFLTEKFGKHLLTGCFLHDKLFLYCPLCGGTRAISALLHFQFGEALRCNAFVFLCFLLFLVFYVSAWIRLIRKRTPILKIPGWIWIVLGVILLLFFVGRNILMVRFGFDPLGDFRSLWNGTR